MATDKDVFKVKLEKRRSENALRELVNREGLVDFSSNDYLGFAGDKSIFDKASNLVSENSTRINGATGSRLLTGHYPALAELEDKLAQWQQREAALVYNSGYAANLGFFSSVPKKDDWILYDEYCHASIRDGIALGNARAYKFKHNSISSLQSKLGQLKLNNPEFGGKVYVVTESVFSMDGDSPQLGILAEFCAENRYNLIVDEAHAVGIYPGGMVLEEGLQNKVFASLITFGKALGCHGAAIICSAELKEFLINYSRSLIYSTALPPHSIATVSVSLDLISDSTGSDRIKSLKENIQSFLEVCEQLGIKDKFISSESAIQSYLVPGNSAAKKLSQALVERGFDVRPILKPTVPEGSERLRFCLHSFNSKSEIESGLEILANLDR